MQIAIFTLQNTSLFGNVVTPNHIRGATNLKMKKLNQFFKRESWAKIQVFQLEGIHKVLYRLNSNRELFHRQRQKNTIEIRMRKMNTSYYFLIQLS